MEVLLEPYGAQFNWDIKLKMMGKKENEAGKMLIGTMCYYLCVAKDVNTVSDPNFFNFVTNVSKE